MNAWLVALVFALASLSCASTAQQYSERLGAGDFAFVYGQGSEWHAYDTLRITGDGRGWYTFLSVVKEDDEDTVVWRGAEIPISDDQLRGLKELINEIGFFRIAPKYPVPGAGDGEQRFVTVRIGDSSKTVQVDTVESVEAGPVAVLKLARYVDDEILAAHRTSFLDAPVIDAEDAMHEVPSELLR